LTKRTTLSLEDDVAARLRDNARRTGRPLKAVVNDAIRAGLDSTFTRARPPFKVEARPMGLRPGVDLDDIAGLIERLEGPQHR
jgi:hypothetical protein